MHEMSIAESVLGIVEEAARREGLARVREVRLEIGRLAAVETEALRFCFDAVVRGSLADGANLAIDEVPGTAWCFGCSQTVPVDARGEPCPRCGGGPLQVNGGTEMRVKEILGSGSTFEKVGSGSSSAKSDMDRSGRGSAAVEPDPVQS